MEEERLAVGMLSELLVHQWCLALLWGLWWWCGVPCGEHPVCFMELGSRARKGPEPIIPFKGTPGD